MSAVKVIVLMQVARKRKRARSDICPVSDAFVRWLCPVSDGLVRLVMLLVRCRWWFVRWWGFRTG